MDKTGENSSGIAVAMAGRKSPWGGGDDTAETGAEAGAETGTAGAAGPAAQDEPAPVGDSASPDAVRPVPPRNPWLPEPAEPAPRRSANIEDIFRQRMGKPSGPDNGAARNWVPLVAAGVFAAWLLGTSIHVLGKGERGLVTTLGKYDRTAGTGLALTLPWPIQAMHIADTSKIEVLELPGKDAENLMMTRDQQLIDLDYQVRWRIADLARFSYGLKEPQAALTALADAQMHAAVAEVPFDSLWEGSRRSEVAQRTGQRIQAVLDSWRAGIKIEGVEIERADPPGKLADAFRKIEQTRKQVRKNTDEAQKWAQQELGNAQSEAEAFTRQYERYKAAPAVVRQRMYYETMERVLVNNKVVVAAAGTGITLAPTLAPTLTRPADPLPGSAASSETPAEAAAGATNSAAGGQ